MQTKLGQFQILEVIGRGGMGTVYRGVDPLIGRAVAVKVIRLVGYNDGDEQIWLKERLFREARAAGGLSHPGIVTIYQVGEEQDVAFIAMEFVDGPTLQDVLAREGRKDMDQLLRVLQQSAAALDYAHERGLVHRDIKPANIMLTSAGLTKVTDFGIAKTMLGNTSSKTGFILGTPCYMSPEQIKGEELDGRSDQFALAVVAYEIVTGRKPFQAEQITSVCYQIIYEEPLSPEDVSPSVGAEAAAVIKKGLSKNRENRYATCVEFADALFKAVTAPEPKAAQPSLRARPAAGTVTAVPPHARRNAVSSQKILIMAAAAVLAVLGIVWLAGRRDREPTTGPIASNAPSAALLERRPIPVRGDNSDSLPVGKRHAVPAKSVVQAGSKLPVEAGRSAIDSIAPSQQAPSPRALHGIAIWAGHISPGMLVTITGASASVGTLDGALPARPIRLQVYPAESSPSGVTVFTVDSRYASPLSSPISRGIALFTFDPRHATDLVVFEAPDARNNWERLVVAVNNPKIATFVVDWSATQP